MTELHDFHRAYGPGPILKHVTPDPIPLHVVHGAYGIGEVIVRGHQGKQDTHYAHVAITWMQTVPYVLDVTFTDVRNRNRVHWTVGRELLRDGGGSGDLRVSQHRTTTWIELDVPSGHARFEIDRVWLADLIAATERIVPVPFEFDAVDFDMSAMPTKDTDTDAGEGGVWW